MKIEVVASVSDVDAKRWDALTDGSPLLSHAFLSALENTHCVGQGTGWQPYPLLVWNEDKLVGAMPLYIKSHSYGEYVFDWSWAEAYERNGIAYYPKLLSAIPFTPITGARLLSADSTVQKLMAQTLLELVQRHQLSSAHVLFPDDVSAEALQRAGWIERSGVQFRWENESFTDFEDFLKRLSHDKRKKIHQERKKISTAGVTSRQIQGADITEQDWDFFYQCYQNTYHEHRSTPYLTREFFSALTQNMSQNVLLIIAEQGGEPIAAALNIVGDNALYGRYWGALRYVPGLHFELCYYQAQEFCIANKIRYFEGGAQGEHKLARGFLSRATRSYHHIAHPQFAAAIKDFAGREALGIDNYNSELEERAPFKKGDRPL
ncbi:MAG: GNAT family N-acetyltransferase [Methylophilaceae bacterium]